VACHVSTTVYELMIWCISSPHEQPADLSTDCVHNKKGEKD